MKRVTPEELRQIVARYRQQLAEANGHTAQIAERINRKIDRMIARLLARGDFELTLANYSAVIAAIRKVIAGGQPELVRALEDHSVKVSALSLSQTAATSAAMYGTLPRRALEVFGAFEQSIASRQILRVTAPYLDRWAAEWSAEWERTVRSVQAAFTQAVVTGQSPKALVAGLVDDLGALQINGRMDPALFAEAFVRTKATELYSDLSIRVAHESGISDFISIGVPDDRQSEICHDASNAGAHSLDWWASSQFGLPPRHVLNCRCSMVGVLDPEADWSQPNPKFETAAAV